MKIVRDVLGFLQMKYEIVIKATSYGVSSTHRLAGGLVKIRNSIKGTGHIW